MVANSGMTEITRGRPTNPMGRVGPHGPNRLAKEQSPYLRQHADNPVDWYPWGPEAFERAKRDDKPIFLSIGYSTCHWCHVMERECFEDQQVAALMNKAFVNIKVDREERPDIDRLYMTVSQIMTGSGGWPLTIVMTPDRKPFFAGTFIPKNSRGGQLGMMELIPRITLAWKENKGDVRRTANNMEQALRRISKAESTGRMGPELIDRAVSDLKKRYDPVHGGFGKSMKFPMASSLLLLLRQWHRTGDRNDLDMVTHSLDEMHRGGIFDQVGFGFHRYSTDPQWLVPHFEKMLYDQALLALVYLEAFQATKDRRFAQTVREIFTYVRRDLSDPQGGFYSAQDADSAGREGTFYLWTKHQIEAALPRHLASVVARVYGVDTPPGGNRQHPGLPPGAAVLHRPGDFEAMARSLEMTPKELAGSMETARQRLFVERSKRTAPFRDDKILTDWNGLMIAAMARAAVVLHEPDLAAAAVKAGEFLWMRLRKNDRLYHRYRAGHRAISAFVDDYAFFVWGLIELYEATHDARHLERAIALTAELVRHHWDEEAGGFFDAADDAEELLVRSKDVQDGSLPSGNSVAAYNLLRLGKLTGRRKFTKMGRRTIESASGIASMAPSAVTMMLVALDWDLGPSYSVTVAGKRDSADTQAMLRAIRGAYRPRTVTVLRPMGEAKPDITRIVPITEHQVARDGKATAYLCDDRGCRDPTTSIQTMLSYLNSKRGNEAKPAERIQTAESP